MPRKSKDNAILSGQTLAALRLELQFSLQRILDRLDMLEVSGETSTTTTADGDPEFTFTLPGAQAVGVGEMRLYFNRSRTISTILASASTAPVGSSLIFDINKNGSTIFTTQARRPTIAAGTHTDLDSVPDILTIESGDYLTVDVDQVGSTTPGSNVIINVQFA